MLRGLKEWLFGKPIDLKSVAERNPLYIDVRTPQEFAVGHLDRAKNIPLQSLKTHIAKIPKERPIIVYCKSGARSSMAKNILKQNGFEVYNGGGYLSLKNKING